MIAMSPATPLAQTAVPADPAAARSAQGELSITIYSDMALVEDVRTITLPAGISRQEFPDVSAAIRPETVTLGGEATDIVEQNFDYDLLSPEKMMRKAEGQTITLLRTNAATGAQTREQAKVLAVNGGVVMQVGDHIEILRDDGLPVRVLFDRIPPNLRARPTLSVTLESSRAGPRPLTLSYLTQGLGWAADYVGLFDEAKGQLNLQGWVTLTNKTGTAFNNARLTLAAGDLLKLRQQAQRADQSSYTVRQQQGGGDEETRVGDLYLYPVAGRTTIAPNQTKQVGFLDLAGAPAARHYRYRCNWICRQPEPQSSLSVLSFQAGAKGGLGHALPAGTVRVYMRDPSGQARFVGESRIDHVAAGAEVDIVTGLAFDVKVHPIVEKRERITGDEWQAAVSYRIVREGGAEIVQVQRQRDYWRTTMRYLVTNARPQAVTVEIDQTGLQGWSEATRVTGESQKGAQDGADTRRWTVEVPARGKAELSVTYLTSF